jgi:hypothetical protein
MVHPQVFQAREANGIVLHDCRTQQIEGRGVIAEKVMDVGRVKWSRPCWIR